MTTRDDLFGREGIMASAQAASRHYGIAKSFLDGNGQSRDENVLARIQVAATLAVADEIRALRHTLGLRQ